LRGPKCEGCGADARGPEGSKAGVGFLGSLGWGQLGECCKLSQWGLGGAPAEIEFGAF